MRQFDREFSIDSEYHGFLDVFVRKYMYSNELNPALNLSAASPPFKGSEDAFFRSSQVNDKI